MHKRPCYAYNSDGSFAFEEPSMNDMAVRLNVPQSNVSVVCSNNIPGEDNRRYTVRGYFLRNDKKEQLSDEEMHVAERMRNRKISRRIKSKISRGRT